jgi:hypothetical protein
MTYYKGLERISQSNVTDCIYTTSTLCLQVIYKWLEGNFTSKASGGVGRQWRLAVGAVEGVGRELRVGRWGRWIGHSWVRMTAWVRWRGRWIDGEVGRRPPTRTEVSPSRRRSPSDRGWVVRLEGESKNILGAMGWKRIKKWFGNITNGIQVIFHKLVF